MTNLYKVVAQKEAPGLGEVAAIHIAAVSSDDTNGAWKALLTLAGTHERGAGLVETIYTATKPIPTNTEAGRFQVLVTHSKHVDAFYELTLGFYRFLSEVGEALETLNAVNKKLDPNNNADIPAAQRRALNMQKQGLEEYIQDVAVNHKVSASTLDSTENISPNDALNYLRFLNLLQDRGPIIHQVDVLAEDPDQTTAYMTRKGVPEGPYAHSYKVFGPHNPQVIQAVKADRVTTPAPADATSRTVHLDHLVTNALVLTDEEYEAVQAAWITANKASVDDLDRMVEKFLAETSSKKPAKLREALDGIRAGKYNLGERNDKFDGSTSEFKQRYAAVFPFIFWLADVNLFMTERTHFETIVMTPTDIETADASGKKATPRALFPFNWLTPREEFIIKHIINAQHTHGLTVKDACDQAIVDSQDSPVPITEFEIAKVMKNQIALNLIGSGGTMWQHAALYVDGEFGPTLEAIKEDGVSVNPPPPTAYYDNLADQLPAIVVLPILAHQEGLHTLPREVIYACEDFSDFETCKAAIEKAIADQNIEEPAEVLRKLGTMFTKANQVREAVGGLFKGDSPEGLVGKLKDILDLGDDTHKAGSIGRALASTAEKLQNAKKYHYLLDLAVRPGPDGLEGGILEQIFTKGMVLDKLGLPTYFVELVRRECIQSPDADQPYGLVELWEELGCSEFGHRNFKALVKTMDKGIDAAKKKAAESKGAKFEYPMVNEAYAKSQKAIDLAADSPYIDQIRENGDPVAGFRLALHRAKENGLEMSPYYDAVKAAFEALEAHTFKALEAAEKTGEMILLKA